MKTRLDELGGARALAGHTATAAAAVPAPPVLAITSAIPWPLDTGGHLRTFYILRALARRCRVRLVTTAAHGDEQAAAALRGHGIEVEAAPVGPRSLRREACRALAAAWRGEPYVLYRRHDRRAVRRLVLRYAQAPPTALYLDHLDSFLFRPLLPGVPCVLDLHNIYSTIARRAARERPPGPARIYLRREAALLERVERTAARASDVLLAVSDDEARYFAGLGARDSRVVPNGVDCDAYSDLPVGRPPSAPMLLYVGAMSWEPNVRAARFLALEVLPWVRARMPGARLRIVGRDPSPAVVALRERPGVEVTGTVLDVRPHLRDAHVLAVPLETGGGTRLKILEAFAAGLPVVSTPVGCEGLRVAHGEHLLIAGRDDFAGTILELLADPDRGRRLAGRARGLARKLYDWQVVGEAACDALLDVIRRTDPSASPR